MDASISDCLTKEGTGEYSSFFILDGPFSHFLSFFFVFFLHKFAENFCIYYYLYLVQIEIHFCIFFAKILLFNFFNLNWVKNFQQQFSN